MKYGEHTLLVEEVIDFAFGGGVLSAVGPAEETAEVWITNDLRLALEVNAGEGELGRFRMAAEVEVSGWGNTDLLAHNLATGDDLRVVDVRDELAWTWHDLTENLAGSLWANAGGVRPDREPIRRLLFKRFHGSGLERQLRDRLGASLPEAVALPGWLHAAEQMANNAVSELRWCAENRACRGLTDNFWERLVRLYREGLWPCGWRGVYPRPGKFVAYQRAWPASP
jgi:hypothetical protein